MEHKFSSDGLHNHLQLASIGYNNPEKDNDFTILPQHPLLNQKEVDPVANMLLHMAHPTKDTPDQKLLEPQLNKMAQRGLQVVKSRGVDPKSDLTMTIDEEGDK